MATMWRRAMTYLGLGPDEEYEDYDDLEPAREPAAERDTRSNARAANPLAAPPNPSPNRPTLRSWAACAASRRSRSIPRPVSAP